MGTNIEISDTYSIESYNWFHFYFQVSWAHKTSDGGLDFLTIGNSTYTSESRISSVFLHPSNWGLRIANLQVESHITPSFRRAWDWNLKLEWKVSSFELSLNVLNGVQLCLGATRMRILAAFLFLFCSKYDFRLQDHQRVIINLLSILLCEHL